MSSNHHIFIKRPKEPELMFNGEKLAKLRIKKGLKVTELAILAAVDHARLRQYEINNEHYRITGREIQALATALDCRPEQFMEIAEG